MKFRLAVAVSAAWIFLLYGTLFATQRANAQYGGQQCFYSNGPFIDGFYFNGDPVTGEPVMSVYIAAKCSPGTSTNCPKFTIVNTFTWLNPDCDNVTDEGEMCQQVTVPCGSDWMTNGPWPVPMDLTGFVPIVNAKYSVMTQLWWGNCKDYLNRTTSSIGGVSVKFFKVIEDSSGNLYFMSIPNPCALVSNDRNPTRIAMGAF